MRFLYDYFFTKNESIKLVQFVVDFSSNIFKPTVKYFFIKLEALLHFNFDFVAECDTNADETPSGRF